MTLNQPEVVTGPQEVESKLDREQVLRLSKQNATQNTIILTCF